MEEKTIPEISLNTRMLFERLKPAQQRDVLTYSELSAVIGLDVQKEGYHHLYSARRKAEVELGMVFEAIENVGIKRLDDNGIIASYTDRAVDLTRKKARRYRQKLTKVVDYNSLPDVSKVKHNATLTVLWFFEKMTQHKRFDKIKQVVSSTHKTLSFDKTLELFK